MLVACATRGPHLGAATPRLVCAAREVATCSTAGLSLLTRANTALTRRRTRLRIRFLVFRHEIVSLQEGRLLIANLVAVLCATRILISAWYVLRMANLNIPLLIIQCAILLGTLVL